MKFLTQATICFGLAAVVAFFTPVHSASALTISPVKVEVTGNPGQTLNGEMELLNEQTMPKTLYSSFENFEPSGETGSPKFVGGTDGLATWMNTNSSVTVNSTETIKVPYTITIPQDAEPGGYFSAIFWGEQDPSELQAGEVSIGGKLGVLILLRVAGDIKEAAGISDFILASSSFFKNSLPVAFTYRFKNDGADRVVPLGDIVITNTLGMTAATIPANQTEGSVLPRSIRKFQSMWGASTASSTQGFFSTVSAQARDFHIGLYKATVSVTYGASNQTATAAVRFFLFPWQLMLVVGGFLLVLVVGLKRYNAWIIAKSKTQS